MKGGEKDYIFLTSEHHVLIWTVDGLSNDSNPTETVFKARMKGRCLYLSCKIAALIFHGWHL